MRQSAGAVALRHSYPPPKLGDCTPNVFCHVRSGRDELRLKPWEQPDEIVSDQHLAVAMRTGADANGRKSRRGGDLLGDVRMDEFEQKPKCTGGFDRTRIRQEAVRLGCRLSLDAISALDSYALRLHADVRHHRNSRVRERGDLRDVRGAPLELYAMRARLNESARTLDRFFRGIEGIDRKIGEDRRSLRT